jgi:hypothetical protein
MKIVHGSKGGGADVSVQCCVCQKMVRIEECLMDLDGPAFQAYYHSKCLVEAREEELA